MLKKTVIGSVNIFICLSTVIFSLATAQDHQDIVHGNLIQFDENGVWCWYQDERVVVDTDAGKIITGGVASASGWGGWPVNGDINANIFDLNSMTVRKYLIKKGGGNVFYCDDHNVPAFLVRPDGKYLTMFAGHFNDTTSHYRIYDDDEWGPEQIFDWNEEIPGGSNFQTTYSNLLYLSNEGRVYNFARTNNKSPNFMISTDMGDTWTYGGQLTSGGFVGYNNGYFKYWGNGIDRIDFSCTEYHPRDYNTSVYHGYIQNGKTYTSDGAVVDDDIFNQDYIPFSSDFTTVFAAGTSVNGNTMYRAWNIDVQYYNENNIAALVSTRINNNETRWDDGLDPDHAFFYCRYNGTGWSYTYLGRAGHKLYASEQDYTGLGALHPNDPNTIYISTPVDPRDDTDLDVHEIFKGSTKNNGNSWEWSPVTWNSVKDNLRPVIPAWDEHHTALIWLRGTYASAQVFHAVEVGLIENDEESATLKTFVDANTTNTTLANGDPLIYTGPSGNMGPADDTWHIRSGFANGNEVFASGEAGGEDAPVLKTALEIVGGGTCDIWVHFWANPNYDWRIRAGLSEDNMHLYRQAACRQVDESDFDSAIIFTDAGNTFLYQAFIGRVELSSAQSTHTVNIFIDDETIESGTSGTRVGDTARTWYDGVSYARVENSNAGIGALVNGDFSSGDNGWELVVQEPAAATGDVIEGEFRINITNAGTDGWDVQLHQFNLFIENNKTYEVAFDAYTTADKLIYMGVGQNSDPWTMYGGIQSFTITQNMQTYSYSFTHTGPTDAAARIVFDVGLSAIDIAFDNIMLRELPTEVQRSSEDPYAAKELQLMQNYPNPFNPVTQISYFVPETGYISLKVHDLLGRNVAVLYEGVQQTGNHVAVFDGTRFAGGVYLYSLKTDQTSKTRKLLLMK